LFSCEEKHELYFSLITSTGCLNIMCNTTSIQKSLHGTEARIVQQTDDQPNATVLRQSEPMLTGATIDVILL
jgi:hypothetical protein